MERKHLLYCAVVLGSFIVTYPQTLFAGVKNALDSVNAIVEEVSLGLRSLSAGLDFVDQFVQTAGSEECRFHCPSGKKLVPNQKYKPVPSGCGAYGVTLSVKNSPQKEFTECCNYHDICYGTCLSKKEICDEKFDKCLNKACAKRAKELGEKQIFGEPKRNQSPPFHRGIQKTPEVYFGQIHSVGIPMQPSDCRMAAKVFYAGTIALGCKAFLDAQAEACICT